MKTLIWKEMLYQSLLYFNLQSDDDRYTAESRIIGCYNDKIYVVDYRMFIDINWIIKDFLIESEINKIKRTLEGKKHQDQWEINKVTNSEFNNLA